MPTWATALIIGSVGIFIVLPLVLKFLMGPRFIGNTEVGIVERTGEAHSPQREAERVA